MSLVHELENDTEMMCMTSERGQQMLFDQVDSAMAWAATESRHPPYVTSGVL